ncbi:terminase small subunit [Pantoea sp. Al-1710]|uniref:Terminase small subunit n=1 Tax=Candidatus Pantoea communis TaxID=2608354 RepID=A0ABX0RJS9_9GAMM|nr:terminase small subunit [Pantoea communis]NIG17293.1 terminase small subunit [Pantoea communis]
MLTTKKRTFAEVLMTGEHRTKAAIKAGYSAASAKYKGYELSKNKEVLAYIERLKALNPQPVEPDPEPVPAIEPVQKAKTPPKVDIVSETIPEGILEKAAIDDPLVVMRRIMNDNLYTDPKLSLDAAAKLAPYVSAKIGEGGKKEQKSSAAKLAINAFASMQPPKLVVNN